LLIDKPLLKRPFIGLLPEYTESLRTNIQLVQIENTPELKEYRSGISSTPKFMSNTFSLFETALKRRPKKLVVEKKI